MFDNQNNSVSKPSSIRGLGNLSSENTFKNEKSNSSR